MKDIVPRWTPTIAEAVLDACLAEIPRQMALQQNAGELWRKNHHIDTRQSLEAAAEELDILIAATKAEKFG